MDRRAFLATTMTSGVLAVTHSSPAAAGAAYVTDVVGRSKADLPTPALLVDLDAFEANVQKMAAHCRQAGCGYRPHAKTHKCPEIARRQRAAGALGISVATVAEAEALAAAGITGLLLTSPVVEARKLARVAALVRQGSDLMAAVGSPLQAKLLAEAAEAVGVTIGVLVDLDVGDRRTGAIPGQPALELARDIGRLRPLQIRGVQAYAGHASHTVGFAARKQASQTAMQKAVDTRELLEKNGFDVRILSGGSTGTYNIDAAIAGVTELQVGSYVFMDVDYRRIGGQDGGAVYTDFQPSLTVLTTVVNATHPDRVTVDAGTKALDTTTTNLPQAKSWPGLVYAKHGDEFGAVTVEGGGKLPALGDRIEFIVPHCDPSVNLYDRLYACRGDTVEAVWTVSARREHHPPASR